MSHSLANNLGRLTQGVGTCVTTFTNTEFFICRCDIPAGRKVTYSQLVAIIRSHKTETHRVRVTVVGKKLDFPGVTTTSCASLTTNKCLVNSTVSTPNACFLILDIKNYYNTPMNRYEYMKISLSIIPEEIILQYNLRALSTDG